MNKIKEFRGDYRWLSNFHLCLVVFEGKTYPSVEHAYMSAKSDAEDWKQFCSDHKNTPGVVKRASRNIKLVSNWDQIKLDVMRECLESKFENEALANKLRLTGDAILEEGNTWGDTFWGIDLRTGKGHNNLGKLLMEIRDGL